MSYYSWQAELKKNAAKVKYLDTDFNISDGGQTPMRALVGVDGLNLGGAVIRETVTLVAAAGTSSPPAANADVQDEFIAKLRIFPDTRGTYRSQALNRVAVECYEQISGNFNKRVYPQATPGTIAKAATVTSHQSIFIPIGGPSAAIQIDVPAISAAFSRSPTSSNRTYDYLGIFIEDPSVISFIHNTTPTLNNGDNSFLDRISGSLAPDFVGFQKKSTITAMYAEGRGRVVYKETSNDFTWQQNTQPDLAPSFTGGGQGVLWLPMEKLVLDSFVVTTNATTALDLMQIDWSDPKVDPPAPKADSTPAPRQTGNVPGGGLASRGVRGWGMRRIAGSAAKP